MPPVQSPTTQIVEIPLEKILPNPENPRGTVSPEAAQAMADSLKEAGQKTEIRVRSLAEAEKQAHPGYDYLLIGGHVRLAGAKLAGLPTLRAILVQGTTPGQELLDAVLDNRWEEMGWWQWDLAIEKLLKPTNGEGQRKLAAQLGMDKSKVNRAWKVTQALNPSARVLVTQSVSPRDTQNKGFSVTESILLVLADLGTPLEVEKALRRAINDQMTESQVRALVAAMKAGTPAQNYVPASPKPKTSKTAPAASPEAAQAPKAGTTPDVSSQIGALMAAHTLGKGIPGAGLVTGRLFPHITNLFHGTKGRLMKMGVKNHLMGTIFTLLIFLFVGGALISFTSRLLSRIYLFTLFSPKAAPSEKASMPSPNPGGSPDPVQPPTTPNSSLLTSNSAKPANSSPKDPTAHLSIAGQQRVQTGTSLAADFAKVFYGLSYKTFSDWGVNIGRPLYTPYYGQLILTFFPELKLEGMQKRKLDESFDPIDPPKVVGVDGNGETILVKGTAIIQSDLKYQGQLMAMGPVALKIHVNHGYPNHPGGLIDKVQELTALDFDWTNPAEKPASSVAKPQGNLGQAVGAGVHDATDAVNKADAADSAVDKAKNLLGF